MNYATRMRRAPDSALPNDLRDDRDLLALFGMSYTDASVLVSKTRQAIHQGLSPRSDEEVPEPYFKLGEILTLAVTARERGRQFEAKTVLDYIERTGRRQDPIFDVLQKLLEPAQSDVETDGAAAILLVLAAFPEMRGRYGSAAETLKDVVSDAMSAEDSVPVFVVSTTSTRAKLAASSLGPIPVAHCFGSDDADYFLPSIIVFGEGEPAVFTLVREGGFMAAADNVRATMADRAFHMLPEEVRAMIEERRAALPRPAVKRDRSRARAA